MSKSRLNEIAKFADAMAKKPKKAKASPDTTADDTAPDAEEPDADDAPVGGKKPMSGKQKAAVAMKMKGPKA